MRKQFLILSLLYFCTSFASPAWAISKKISSPYILGAGTWKVEDFGEVAFDYGHDDNAVWKNEAELKYGLLPWLEISASAETIKAQGDNFDYDSSSVGAKFPLAPRGNLPVDLAGKIAFDHADNSGDPDKIKGQILFSRGIDAWKIGGKLTLEDEIGDDSEDAFEMGLGLALMHQCTEEISAGIEYYADIGPFDADKSYREQEHQIGPVIGFSIPGTPVIKSKIGYLQGISKAAKEGTLKYEFAVSF